MRTNETVRSRTLYHATLRKMLALGCAALLLLGSMLGSVVFMLLHHHGRYGGIADSDYHSVHFYSEILCRKLCFQRRKRLTGKR